MFDRAGLFSLKTIELLRRSFAVDRSDSGAPILQLHRINELSVAGFFRAYQDLYKSSERADAISDFESYQASNKRLQTTAVGLAPDFDTLKKLGLILGDRVVLWDTVLVSSLSGVRQPGGQQRAARAIFDVMELERLIELGGAVFLPHPATWLDRATRYFEALKGSSVPNEVKGFLNAASLLDEKFAVHPFMYQDSRTAQRVRHQQFVGDEANRYRPEILEHHYSLQRLLEDQRMPYLQNVSVEAFYQIVRKPGRQRATIEEQLGEALRLDTPGASIDMQERKLDDAMENLAKLVPSYSRELAMQLAQDSAAGLGVVGSAMALLSGAEPLTAVALMTTGMVPAVIQTVLQIIDSSPKPVLFQVFQELRDEVQREHLRNCGIPDVPFGHG
jgi:hypothetical protein